MSSHRQTYLSKDKELRSKLDDWSWDCDIKVKALEDMIGQSKKVRSREE